MPDNKNQPKNNDQLRDEDMQENEGVGRRDQDLGLEDEEAQDQVSRGGRIDQEDQSKPDKDDDDDEMGLDEDIDDEPTGRQPRVDE